MLSLRKLVASGIALLLVFLGSVPVAWAQAPAGPAAAPAPAAASATVESPTPAELGLQPGWWKMPAAGGPMYLGERLDAPRNQAPAPGGKRWTRGGKIMTGIGVVLVGVGAVMMTGPSRGQLGDSDLYVDWKTTGAIWMSIGGS
jgi:hypothetical protein